MKTLQGNKDESGVYGSSRSVNRASGWTGAIRAITGILNDVGVGRGIKLRVRKWMFAGIYYCPIRVVIQSPALLALSSSALPPCAFFLSPHPSLLYFSSLLHQDFSYFVLYSFFEPSSFFTQKLYRLLIFFLLLRRVIEKMGLDVISYAEILIVLPFVFFGRDAIIYEFVLIDGLLSSFVPCCDARGMLLFFFITVPQHVLRMRID